MHFARGDITPREVLVLNGGGKLGSAIARCVALVGHRCVAQVRVGEHAPKAIGLQVWESDDLVQGPRQQDVAIIVPACLEPERENAAASFEIQARVARELGARRLVVVSSIEASGPLRFDDMPAYEGGHAERPTSPLGHAALAVERAALALGDREGLEVVVLRAGHLYGEGIPGCVLPFLEAADGQTPDWLLRHQDDHLLQPVHLLDLAQAVALAVGQGAWIYHITAQSCPSVGELSQGFSQACAELGLHLRHEGCAPSTGPSQDRIHFGYPDHRAERELGFVPRIDFADGVAPLVYELRLGQLVAEGPPGGRRPFRLGDSWMRLQEDGDSRRRDLELCRVTFARLESGGEHCLTAEQLSGSVEQPESRALQLRELCEELLDLGFDDRWMRQIIGFVGRHGLLNRSARKPS